MSKAKPMAAIAQISHWTPVIGAAGGAAVGSIPSSDVSLIKALLLCTAYIARTVTLDARARAGSVVPHGPAVQIMWAALVLLHRAPRGIRLGQSPSRARSHLRGLRLAALLALGFVHRGASAGGYPADA